MSKLAFSSVTVINVNDGNGIVSSSTSYAISPFGNDVPIEEMIDEEGNILFDSDDQLLFFKWSDEIPENVPEGWYLWTKLTVEFTDGGRTDAYSVSKFGEDGKDGNDGAKGQDAPKIISVTPEYCVSDSNLELTEDEWDEEKPEIEPGQFLWTRYRTDFDDGTLSHSTSICDTTLSGVLSVVNRAEQSIENKVWQTDITTSINAYDNTTGSDIRDRISATEQDINTMTSTMSDIQTTVTSKADSSTVTTLTNRVSAFEQDVDGFRQTVSATYATKSSISEFITGTQSSATSSWEGTSANISSLVDGQQITYWLPYDSGENTTLTLTLNNNTTTQPIPIYYGSNTRLGTEYVGGSIIHLTYRENVSVNGSALTGWWADANYDSGNTFDRIKYNGIVKASTSITRQSIIVSNGSGFSPLNTGDPFNVNYPILCALDENIVAEGTSLNCYMVCPMSITQTQQIDLIPGKSVYVKGSLSGLTFTPINQLCITQTIPVNEDGYFYLLLGTSFGTGETTRDFYLQADHPIYVYKSGIGFTKVETAALSVAEQTASGFRWVVQSGTSETDFELTDRTAELVSDYINLHGLVEFNGLNSDTKSRINNAQSAANQAQSTADAASASALLANTTINAYKDANNVIIGNQVQDTAVFTGIARFNNLVDGQQITYWLPFDYSDTDAVVYQPAGGAAESGAGLDLTLSTGASTGTVPIFYNGLQRLTDQYAGGNIIRLVYRENVTLSGKNIVAGWWADANYDSGNTYDRIRYQQNIKASEAITYDNIIVGYNGGYHNLNNGDPFDLTYPILWCGNTLSANQSGNNNFICIPFYSTVTQDSTWQVGKPVFICGTLSGTIFTPVSSSPLTQVVPVSNDGYYYILLGNTYATNGIYLTYNHEIYKYYDGSFKTISQIATEAAVTAVAAKTTADNAKDWIENVGSNATEILATWTADSTLETTVIDGGYIKTNTIQARHLATDAIMSNNYVAASSSSPFSAAGSYLNLANGNFYTPNFGIDNISGTAFINGQIVADSGAIGNDDDNYWEIGTKVDYNGDDSAAMIGHGTSYIQSGWWQISNNRINTQQYSNSNQITYIYDNANYYDYGMQLPNLTSSRNGEDAFLYVRKSVADSIPLIPDDWNYLFKVDKNGAIYENGIKLSDKYVSMNQADAVFVPITGGTITGDLVVNGSLDANAASASSLTHNLSINGISWDGSSNYNVGTMAVPYGGTGKSSWTSNRLIYANSSNSLSELGAGTSGYVLVSNGSSAPSWVDPSTLVSDTASKAESDADGNVITETYRKLTNNIFENIYSTNGNIGNLVVTGSGTFTNGLFGNLTGNVIGNLTGTASNASKVEENLIIQLNGGLSEGNTLFTYDGSVAKRINIDKGSIGLANVDNTPDASKSVAYATNAGNASTSDAAAVADALSSNVSLTIGGTTKSTDWSSNLSFSKTEISGNASTSAAGWMSAADKSKLDSITIDAIGTVSASSIVGTGGISATVSNGVATVSHSNTQITAGTIKGTNTSTLSNGGSFNIPSITYDSYGHITATGTTTLTLPTISNDNTYDCRLLSNVTLIAGTRGIYGYNIVMENSSGQWESLVTSYSNGTTKARNTTGFRIGKIYWYNSSTTVSNGNYTGQNIFESISSVSFRYTSNCGTTLSSRQPLYLVGTIENNLFYLDTKWWTQALPSTEDGKVYIYIGEAYSNSNFTFSANHPIYEYKDGYIRQYGGISRSEISSALGYDLDTTYLKLVGGTLTGTLTATGFIGNLTGNADSATTAIKDGNGNTITNTYIPFGGTTISNPNTSSFSLTNGITGNYLIFTNSGTTSGVGKGVGGVNGANDAWVIRGYQTASNAGALELAVGDDGNEGIYVRQYYGSTYYLPFMNKAGTDSGITYRELILMEPNTGNTKVQVTTASTSKTTGALTVAGGVGVAGNIHANSFSVNDKVDLVWNEDTSSIDFVFN